MGLTEALPDELISSSHAAPANFVASQLESALHIQNEIPRHPMDCTGDIPMAFVEILCLTSFISNRFIWWTNNHETIEIRCHKFKSIRGLCFPRLCIVGFFCLGTLENRCCLVIRWTYSYVTALVKLKRRFTEARTRLEQK